MVSHNVPFGEPLIPKTSTMRKIRGPQNTLKNKSWKYPKIVKIGLQMGVTLFRVFVLLASFFTTCFEDGSWRPQKLQNQEKYKKHQENVTLFSSFWASTVAWQAKFTATVAGAAGRLQGGVEDQNKPMATVAAMLDLFWSAHPP